MTTLRTDLGNSMESARRIRFETTGAIPATNVQRAIEQVAALPPAIAINTLVDASFTAGIYVVQAADSVILVNATGPVTVQLPLSANRGGLPVEIKDASGNASVNTISVTHTGGETTDGLAIYPINSDFGGYKFSPKAAGGYFIGS